MRVINAMLDIAAGFGLLETTLGLLRLHQMLVQVGMRCAATVSSHARAYRHLVEKSWRFMERPP